MSRVKRTGKDTPWTPDKVRGRIQTSVVLTRLTKHVLGTLELSATQVRAAEILLRKTIPDLSATEFSGELTQRVISATPMSIDDWRNTYTDDDLGSATGATESTH